jgi:hypothetical protein
MSAAYATLPTTLHPRHARELYDASGIDPDVVAARGYRSVDAAETARLGFAPSQQRDGLLLPQWTLAGVQVGDLLKPDDPRLDEKGKPIKYEAPAGSRPHFDIHPDARHILQEASTPLYFTEGVKKSDAAWSRGVACVSITSVWMFLNGRLVVPDLDEIALDGRRVRVVFDSDVTRKPSVAEALLRFCAALDRRGAKVEVVYLPEGPNGAKVGLDDWFVAGGTVEQLEALARPWDGQGPGIRLRTPGDVDPDEQARTISALVQAIQNPEHTLADLRLMAATAALAQSKRAAGKVASDGRVILNAAEIADDYRPVPDKEQRKAEVNPNGTKPRLVRSSVKPLMRRAIERGLLPAEPVRVHRKHASGTSYPDTDWAITPTDSLAAMLEPWATFRPTEPKQRKPRTLTPPCPNCGEVHPIKRYDYCEGCGALTTDGPVTIQPITEGDSALDILSRANSDPGDDALVPSEEDTDPHSPAPRLRIVAAFQHGTGHNPYDEPDWLADAPESAEDDATEPPPLTLFSLPSIGCQDCGAAIGEGQTYCRSCDHRTA